MSKFKDQTEGTLPSSSAESTVAKEQPSSPSASSDNTPVSTPTTKKPSQPMLSKEPSGSTTPRTTPKITERTRQHAMLARVALQQLEKAGLIKRSRVLSKEEDGSTTLKEMRVVFDAGIWTEELELK